MSFWDIIFRNKELVLGLSPMDGVTDAPFRYMVAKYGKPDVIFTEFVSVDGLHYAEGAKKERMLMILRTAKSCSNTVTQCHVGTSQSWPYEIAQVFGNKPEFFVEAAKLVESLGFDGIDINMGCPAKNVSENGCGAGLIRTPKLAQEIILATKAATKLPVSVKTRIGVSSSFEMEEWIEALCEVRPANISLHGRTLKQLYQGSADWEAIGRAAEIVHKNGLYILGNGDVQSVHSTQYTEHGGGLSAEEAVLKYGVDGVLIGRAAEGNPGIFNSQISNLKFSNENKDREQRLAWAVEHSKKFEALFGQCHGDTVSQAKAFLPMRKHLAWYAHGFPGAAELRTQLMKTTSASEVEMIIREFKKN